MKRTCCLIGFAFAILSFTGCTNPFSHSDHSNGIAYFKTSRFLGPFLLNEVDSAELPFTVNGGIVGLGAIGKRVIVHLNKNDSIDVLYLVGTTEHLFHTKFNKRISDDLFSIILRRTDYKPQPDDRSVYSFKFLKDMPVKHDGGIGYYRISGQDKTTFRDITEIAPFKVELIRGKDNIANVPIFLTMLTDRQQHRYGLAYSKSGHEYEGYGNFDDTLKMGFGQAPKCIIRLNRPITTEDLNYKYVFTIEK